MLATLNQVLKIAEEKQYAIAAFNTPTLESLQAAVDKADSLDLNDYIDNDAKAAMPDALEAAKEVLADETASQEAVDEQTIALYDILMGLR